MKAGGNWTASPDFGERLAHLPTHADEVGVIMPPRPTAGPARVVGMLARGHGHLPGPECQPTAGTRQHVRAAAVMFVKPRTCTMVDRAMLVR
jgi:hypothetical protein